MTDKKRSFWALMATQFFGAFNDNLFKIATALLVTRWVSDIAVRNNWVSASNILFVLPFLLFSLAAGRMADRWSKRNVIVATKLFEIGVIFVAVSGLGLRNIPIMMAGLGLLALQSAFFGPAKYGILPELIQEKNLSNANGLLNIFTIAAILAGTIVGSLLIDSPGGLALFMGLVTVCGLAASLLIEKGPPASPGEAIKWNPFPEFVRNWRMIKDNIPLSRSLIAVAYFWFFGAVLILNTIVYVKDILHAAERLSGMLLFFNGIGIALGSWVAGRLSREKVELGLVPVGAILMSLFTIDLFFAQASLARVFADCVMMGFSAGLFIIPLNTLIQARSPKAARGRVLATANFLSFVAISLATPFFWISSNLIQFDPAQTFLVLGLLSVVVTIVLCVMLPQAPVRLVLYLLTNTIYRIRVVGRENVPLEGPALLVPNHVSMVDPFLISGGLSRLIRFVMFREFYEKPLLHPFLKLMESIPIDSRDNPKDIMRSLLAARKKLEEGRLVCIFAEGQISRLGGATLGFQRGIGVILKGLSVPVVPVHLEGVWGSIFSFAGKKFLWKWPRKLPYPVTVTFGKPLQNPTPHEIRQAVMELGSEAFAIHRRKEPTLFSSFLNQAKRTPDQMAVADSSGKNLTYRKLTAATYLLGKKLSSLCKNNLQFEINNSQCNVGVLIPPSIGAVMANLALTSQGMTPVNLNYTLPREDIEKICQKASIGTVITSEKLFQRLGWEASERYIFLEDVFAGIKKREKAWAGVLTTLLPRWGVELFLFPKSRKKLDNISTILFTSGSTGDPKGVMLTEGNILSNIQSITMLLQLDQKDGILGILPFFHSFGLTASLWFPLLAGFKAVYHNNPLDAKTVGRLSRDYRATFLMGTPSFLTAYQRRVPKEDFASLRFAVAGAEKLRPELARAFEEKFGVPVLEGYGCTELSPVVALNIPDIMDGEVLQVGRKVGKIGRAIPGVSVKVVDPDTMTPKNVGEPGLLLVKGPNVMKGYLNDPEKTAEVMAGGYYITGDIATIDEDGFIEITDRLSRFSKIAGEMIPHIKVEEKLQELSGAADRIFVVTSIPDERRGEALVVLTAGFSGNMDELWRRLSSSGLPNLWIPARENVREIEAIPVLGSGKVDMQSIKKLLSEKFQSN